MLENAVLRPSCGDSSAPGQSRGTRLVGNKSGGKNFNACAASTPKLPLIGYPDYPFKPFQKFKSFQHLRFKQIEGISVKSKAKAPILALFQTRPVLISHTV